MGKISVKQKCHQVQQPRGNSSYQSPALNIPVGPCPVPTDISFSASLVGYLILRYCSVLLRQETMVNDFPPTTVGPPAWGHNP